MNNQNKRMSIGLEAGDPEQIAEKGLKCLQAADVTYYPATEVSSNGNKPFSVKI